MVWVEHSGISIGIENVWDILVETVGHLEIEKRHITCTWMVGILIPLGVFAYFQVQAGITLITLV